MSENTPIDWTGDGAATAPEVPGRIPMNRNSAQKEENKRGGPYRVLGESSKPGDKLDHKPGTGSTAMDPIGGGN